MARRAAVSGIMFALAACSQASAAWVGDRYFPSTLATTVPTPADFLNPPNLVVLPRTATTPSVREIDIPTTFSKLITPDWALTFTETYRILEQANAPTRKGFDNFVLGTQYELYANAPHQFVFTLGATAAFGGTGSSQVANSFSTFTPTIQMGKGFGDLPDSVAWLRPINITSNVGVALPSQTANPNILLWSFALEYSLLTTMYSGGDHKGSRFSEGWVPLVEFALTTPLEGPAAGRTTGTINPGVIWVSRYLQVAVEAIIPINGLTGHGIGARAQAHLYFSEIFPDTLGRPIFGK
jgi:hypothetical protein